MKWIALLVVALSWVGCEGSSVLDPNSPARPGGGPGVEAAAGPYVAPTGDPAAPDACEGIPVAAGTTALRRLSLDEQRNTFRDLLADPTLNPDLMPPSGAVITEVEVEKLNLAAAAMVAKGGHLPFLPCSSTGSYNATCLDTFFTNFGRFVFRHPVTTAERAWLKTDIVDALRNNTAISPTPTFRELVDAAAQAMLQGPELLYVNETGATDVTLPAGIRRLTGFERATRLSFLLWKTTPDQALLSAAAAGELDSATGLKSHAERLLSNPRAKVALREFVSSWMELDGNSHQASLETMPKSLTAFPFDSPALRSAMREEVMALYEQSFAKGAGSFKDLFTSRRAYVNKTLGTVYGVASPPASDSTFVWVDLDPTQRAGLFTRSAFLALQAPQEQKSPIRRGVFTLRRTLCQPLGAPPPDVNNSAFILTNEALTIRQQVEARTASAACQSCHGRINPLGFTMEKYDAMGRFHTRETGTLNNVPYDLAVNAAATPVGTDLVGSLDGAVALSQQLSESGMAHDCMATTWFQRANARPLTAADACNLQRLMRKFRQTDDMRDLVATLATDEGALFLQETP
jgi:hypothetical protein